MNAKLDAVARFIHAIHGTRGLLLALGAMLFMTLIEAAIPVGLGRAILAVPIFLVGMVGLATLPREGVAVQKRLRNLVEDEGAGKRLLKHLLLPIFLVVLLLPQAFLAGYGIPHMSPFTGLLLPSMQKRLAAIFLFGLLLLPVMHLRRTKQYAPEVEVLRPIDLKPDDLLHKQRDTLMALMIIVAVLWLTFLQPFWTPFSLFSWPPNLSSFANGIRDISAVAYAVFLPVILFIHMAAHAQGLRYLIIHVDWQTHWRRFVLLWAHVALGLAAAALHVYNLLWIMRYQSAVGF